jgi:hypothetical protein
MSGHRDVLWSVVAAYAIVHAVSELIWGMSDEQSVH